MTYIPPKFQAKIKKAKERGLKKLDLSNHFVTDDKDKLKEIPPEVFELEQLESLNLSGNHIATIPQDITKLSNFAGLYLRNNQLTTLPESITKLSNLTELDLRNNQLTPLPESISKLSNLTELYLSYNRLTTLPESISKLSNLTELYLRNNKLTTLPESISKLSNLTELYLSYNRLTPLPESISKLSNLTELYLSYNRLTPLPESISKLSNLTELYLRNNKLTILPESISKLSNLTELYLRNNQLTTLPESISKLSNLTQLYLRNNQLTTLPESISKLSNLTQLYLRINQLTTLPESISKLSNLTQLYLRINQLTILPESITKLSNLTQLYLSGNQLTTLPESISKLSSLTQLYLSGNQLTTLPESITKLSNLTQLYLTKNPLVNPPLEIAEKGIEAIRDYFEQLKKDSDYLYEAKLLIVGEAGAGKTTLAKKIQNPDYELQEEGSTQGIDVITWYFPYNNQHNFRMNIWDFGGQEIYHATHQFFLTKRSLYVLVIDNRKEDDNLYYWLNLVELLSDNSPLLIIKNEKQDRERDIDERGLRGQFSNLEKTLATNLKTNSGLGRILGHIKQYLRNLPHVGQFLPKTWKRVREVLEQEDRDYISLEEYFQICQANGIIEREYQTQLSGFLHDLGVCLHFQDDPLLNKIVILKPEWGTDAVYKVLDNLTVRHTRGRFTKQDLASIWQEQQYENARDELLQLMIKFKLCYQIPNHDIYIAPQLLKESQPQYNWEETNNLILRYTYEFMPKGIIIQFIVAMHRHIWKQEYVWKNGVVLEKDETLAEVIEYYSKREIKIRVGGKHKRDLLTTVTYELDKIHDSYQRLKYSKLIPCNCQSCKNNQDPYFYKYNELRERIVYGKMTVECGKPPYEDKVNILSLIDDIMDLRKLAKDKRGGTEREDEYLKIINKFAERPIHNIVDVNTQVENKMIKERIKYKIDRSENVAILEGGTNYGQLIQNNYNQGEKLDQDEVLKLLAQIEAKISGSALAEPVKKKALKNLNSTLDEVQEEEPSADVAMTQLKRMTNTLTEAGKATAEGKKVWENVKPIVIQVAGWLKVGIESIQNLF